MEMVPDDKAKGLETPIWEEYKKIVNDAEKKEVLYWYMCILGMIRILILCYPRWKLNR